MTTRERLMARLEKINLRLFKAGEELEAAKAVMAKYVKASK